MHDALPHEEKGSHPLFGVDARIKLLCAGVLLSMVLTSRGALFPALAGLICLGLCPSLGIGAKRLFVRFSEPAFIAFVLVVIKLFFSGHVVMGSVRLAGIELACHADGLREGLLMGLRIMASVSVIAVLGFATPFTEFLGALTWLKVPKGLIEVSIFAYHYIFLLLDDAMVIYNAQKMRLGYSSLRRGLASFGVLAGALVLKAFDGSQHAALAMVQRGYDGRILLSREERPKPGHLAWSILFLLLMAVLWKR